MADRTGHTIAPTEALGRGSGCREEVRVCSVGNGTNM